MGYLAYEKYRRSLLCSVCKEKAYRKRLCRSCYKRDQRRRFHCTAVNCTSPVFASTLCQRHYRAWQTHCLYCNSMVFCRHLCRPHYRKALESKEFPKVPTCKECDKKTYLNDFCLEHFKKQFKKCIMVECNEPSHRIGLCCKHYFRQRRAQTT